MVIVYLNKNTFEVVNEERFSQLVDDMFDAAENKRLKVCRAELEEVWVRKEVQCAEVRSACPHTRCMYHVEGGCGARDGVMPECFKTRGNKSGGVID